MSDRVEGTVKWFNNRKGYGFIELAPDDNRDIFVHYRDIKGEGYRSLRDGQQVRFIMNETQKGLHALEVETISD